MLNGVLPRGTLDPSISHFSIIQLGTWKSTHWVKLEASFYILSNQSSSWYPVDQCGSLILSICLQWNLISIPLWMNPTAFFDIKNFRKKPTLDAWVQRGALPWDHLRWLQGRVWLGLSMKSPNQIYPCCSHLLVVLRMPNLCHLL